MTTQTTMKAIRLSAFGGPEQLHYEEISRPEPAAGEALIRVHATSVNPIEWLIRSGVMQQIMPVQFPYTPGSDLAGVVESVGEGVTAFQVGQEIYGTVDSIHGGAYAEYVTAPVAQLALKPQTLDFSQAASIPVVASTSWESLFEKAGLAAGQSVLIHGGAGGVGMFAVQFARWKGAHVIATASATDLDFVRSLGAVEVIDYKGERFEEKVSNLDVVLDLIGGETQQRSWQTLKPGGILVSTTAPPSEEEAIKHGVRATMIQMHPSGELLAEIAGLIDSGQVQTFVGATFPLEQAGQAQEANRTGHVRGKIVIQVGE
ncbi:MAG: alcohol dehydrogenase [Chthonomonadaceae bacterium]|nr:alcohol dehydrogenase [Chthonomonadaceae bacterium]